MNKKLPTAERVLRELPPRERMLLDAARAETLAQMESIVVQGLAYKTALDMVRVRWLTTVGKLKARRENLCLSLADVDALTGLERSALWRLENDLDANPTLLTVQRYAAAMGMVASIELKVDRAKNHSRPPGNARESA